MIRRIEAVGYRCLRGVKQAVAPFQVLVGPNASGKSAFLDVVGLIGDILREGLVPAIIHERAPDFSSLVWMGQEERFELAVELEVPAARLRRIPENGHERARYEIAVGLGDSGQLAILGENLWLKPRDGNLQPAQRDLFPAPPPPPPYLVFPENKKSPVGWKKVVTKKPESGNDYFMSETTGWNNPFRLGPQRPALQNLPEDEDKFPAATWVKRVLMQGIQRLALSGEAMRRPAPPGSPTEFQSDGSNLPWAIDELRKDSDRFKRWTEHLRTALPDLREVDTVIREEDRHRYLRVHYSTGLKAPSWAVSDGTLRLLALTLLAYLEAEDRIYLIEEPENGIHPKAVETVFQSLSSAYGSQILCATHSPVILSLVEPHDLLCFAKDSSGATDVVVGTEHPNLRDWQRSTDLGTLFAMGVLG